MKQNVINNMITNCLIHEGFVFEHPENGCFNVIFDNSRCVIETADYSFALCGNKSVLKALNRTLIQWIVLHSNAGTAVEFLEGETIATVIYDSAVRSFSTQDEADNRLLNSSLLGPAAAPSRRAALARAGQSDRPVRRRPGPGIPFGIQNHLPYSTKLSA